MTAELVGLEAAVNAAWLELGLAALLREADAVLDAGGDATELIREAYEVRDCWRQELERRRQADEQAAESSRPWDARIDALFAPRRRPPQQEPS